MSALNFVMQEKIVVIATDTLALSIEKRVPMLFKTKFHLVPHLDGIICGTGISHFIAQWAFDVQNSMLVRNIPELDQLAPEQLRKLWMGLKIPKEFTSKIFHFGYDQELSKFRGFLYNSERSFESEELESNVLWTQPFISDFQKSDDIFENLKRIVSIQRAQELSQPQERRSGIGGDIHFEVIETIAKSDSAS